MNASNSSSRRGARPTSLLGRARAAAMASSALVLLAACHTAHQPRTAQPRAHQTRSVEERSRAAAPPRAPFRSHLGRVTFWPKGQEPVSISAETVATPEGIGRGLMFRRHLNPDHGMLFVMGEDDDHSFWMKNTYIALDLIFIARDLRVVGVIADAQPEDETSLQVGEPSFYVVEVNAGFAARHGIARGTRVALDNVTLDR